jgi:hypothetical protein
MIRYDVEGNKLSLADDSGAAFPYVAIVNSSGAVLQNSQCSVSTGDAVVSFGGTTLSLTVVISFSQAFAGVAPKSVLLYAQDLNGTATGWDAKGTWNVPVGVPSSGTGNTAPTTLAVYPVSGSGLTQTFTFTVADGAGYQNVASVMVLITGTNSDNNSCLFAFEAVGQTILLADDSGLTFPNAVKLGDNLTVHNHQCSLSGVGVSVVGSGTDFKLIVPITFSTAFSGAKTVFVYGRDVFGASAGWDSRGTWTVPSN